MDECVTKVNPDDIEWKELKPFTGIFSKKLYENEKTGQVFQLLRYKEGYVEPRHTHHKGGHAIYVIRGAIIDSRTNEIVVPEGHFWFAPKGDVHGPFKNPSGTLVLFITDCSLDFVVIE